DPSTEPLGQQSGCEPVIAVAVGDEDVGDVAILRSHPVAERLRLIDRERGVRQHGIGAPVDQCACNRRTALRLAVWKEPTVVLRRITDEHVVGECRGRAHGALPPLVDAWVTASMTIEAYSAGASSQTKWPASITARRLLGSR